MNFNLRMWRSAACRSLTALAGAAALASCGGGEQVVKFAPTRLIAFGDEASVIEDVGNNANGRKYTVNAVKADLATLDCKSNLIWIQYLSTAYAITFPQCNPDALALPGGIIRAAPLATVADVVTQIDTQVASGGFSGTDLVTVLAGANDILARYKQYPALSADDAVAAVEQAGLALAEQVNRIGNLGGKVVVATVPDVGLTPYALAEKAAHTDTDRAALLTRLTARFNAKLRLGLINDGRMIGLIFADELIQAMVKNPATYSLLNVIDAVCDPVKAPQVSACTTQTLVTAGSGTVYLWSDALRLSPGGHTQLGSLAITRARGNPF